jgi:monothiol glutaredoxin
MNLKRLTLSSFSQLYSCARSNFSTKLLNFAKLGRQVNNLSLLINNKSLSALSNKYFSSTPTPEAEDSHSDFKPKVKQEINNENVMKLIDEWVKNNEVVLFMKGTREMPRCGFSNYVVQIMNFYKIKKIKVINILENPIVRESVKQYSNWPTYPQLYVKGNLIGGCDIIKEMHENGTFKDLVEREGLQSLD